MLFAAFSQHQIKNMMMMMMMMMMIMMIMMTMTVYFCSIET